MGFASLLSREYLDSPLLPLSSPKAGTLAPQLSLPARPDVTSPFPGISGWSVEPFIFPAATPRSVSTAPSSRPDNFDSTAKVTRDQALTIAKDIFKRQSERVSHKSSDVIPDEQLWIAANRYYKPNSAKIRKTLVFCHANGLHKETWEPTIASLLQHSTDPIDEIWSLDCVIQGDSALLNPADPMRLFDWADHGRDILQFLVHYLPTPSSDIPTTTNVSSNPPSSLTEDQLNPKISQPKVLPKVPSKLANLDLHPCSPLSGSSHSCKECKCSRGREIIAVGHSLGGGGLAYAASSLPCLFSQVIFVDPVVTPLSLAKYESLLPLTANTIARRDKWASRGEALKSLKASKTFFGLWDEKVLERYVQYGMFESQGQVELKARKYDEAVIFADPDGVASKRAFHRLSYIPSSVKTTFVFADQGQSVLPEEAILETVRQVKHCQVVRIREAPHLVAQVKPRELGIVIARMLDTGKAKL